MEEDLVQLFKEAKKIKPKRRLSAKEIDKVIEDKIFEEIPRREP